MASPRCFKIKSNDNVATMLDDGESGGVQVLGQDVAAIELREPIKLGHKVALREIAAGDSIVKFGVAIGRATCDIHIGQWVHLHNCSSRFDERSQTFDVNSGATTDTKYE